MTLTVALICIFAAFALFALIALYQVMVKQINDARRQTLELEERIRQLEHANHHRMNFTTTHEIENVQGINSRVIEILEDALELAKNSQFHLEIAHTPDEFKKNGKQAARTAKGKLDPE